MHQEPISFLFSLSFSHRPHKCIEREKLSAQQQLHQGCLFNPSYCCSIKFEGTNWLLQFDGREESRPQHGFKMYIHPERNRLYILERKRNECKNARRKSFGFTLVKGVSLKSGREGKLLGWAILARSVQNYPQRIRLRRTTK